MSTIKQQGTQQEALLSRSFAWIGFPLLLAAVIGLGLLPMTWQQQALFGTLMVIVALVVSRISDSRAVTGTLIILSMTATARYAIWRTDALGRYFFEPWSKVNWIDAFFMLILFSAELYSFVILYLGFMQTIAPLRRTPVALPSDPALWPTVDIMVPTYNEPMEVVRYTVLAAKQQDWPADKFNVWILDDGNRPEFREFANEAGVGYIARLEHDHAKAGNINHALAQTTADLVAIFDCDHVPTRSFLQVTCGWFQRDSKLGMLQTPHHFYSADPFEKNLGNFRRIPSESELFYGIIQDTNDLWNATFFCGSCAVLRRDALDEVGGIAVETVTEDAHTSLRMQSRGWNTAYINLVQAAGLATETMADHVKQRVRWARGMIQILRVDNPLFARRLSFPQRLCYLNAMLHFLYALPRLIFLTAPILYLVFGKLNIPGYWLAILVFAMPHLLLANIVNSRVQGYKRYSFWNEIYETVLSPYILLPTLFALISPKFGKFNVTAKGQNLEEDTFDSKLARPFLVLLALNVLALCMAVPRYLWDPTHVGTVAMNMVWVLFNIVVLTVALSACCEARQRRQAVRVSVRMPAQVGVTDQISAVVRDLSVTGGSMSVSGTAWQLGDTLNLFFPSEDSEQVFQATVVGIGKGLIRFAFVFSSVREQEAITRVLFSASDRWIGWNDGRSADNILGSLLAVVVASGTGFRKIIGLTMPKKNGRVQLVPGLARATAAILLLLALIWAARSAHAQQRVRPTDDTRIYNVRVDFRTLGARDGILLNGSNRNQAVAVALPDDVLVESGTMHLRYGLPEAKTSVSTLEVLLNGSLLASITPSSTEISTGHGEVTIPLPPEQFVRQNRITLQLAEHGAAACGVKDNTTAPLRIEADSDLELAEQRLVLANDLSLLPAPFAQRSASQATEIPVVFAHTPSQRTLQAAGVVASWFGAQSIQGETRFSVETAKLPVGNALLFLVGDNDAIGGINPAGTGAEIRTLPNPADPFGKLLVISGRSDDDLLQIAQALAAGALTLSGDHASLTKFVLPPARKSDDAPRWISGRRVLLHDLAGREDLATTGDNPLNLYFRFAPDLNFGAHNGMYVHLNYRDDASELDPHSNFVLRLNGTPADSVPLLSGAEASHPHTAEIPLADLPSSRFGNTLQLQFYFVPPQGHECGPNQFIASLGNGSFLDLGTTTHWAALPNLNLFANAGFPFTQFADLSNTAVLLPAQPSAAIISEYLDFLSYFGRATGYPALRVTVGDLRAADTFTGDNLLVLGTFADLTAMPGLAAHLPLQLRSGGDWKLSARAQVVRWSHLLLQAMHLRDGEPSLDVEEIAPTGIVESIASPFGRDHEAVLVLAKDEAAAASAMRDALVTELPHDAIRGTVSLWQAGSFTSYNLATPSYYTGEASFLEALSLVLPEHPVALAVALLTACLALAAWMQFWISARIRLRLMGAPQLEEYLESEA